MKKGKDPSLYQADLRRRAEARLAEKKSEMDSSRSVEDARRLVHELQVHQVELELQNEELRQARQELEASLERYTDLYDFAPVGYLTLDRQGVIGEINLAGAALLGAVRSRVLGQTLGGFLAQDSIGVFDDFLERVRGGQGKRNCQVTMARPGLQPRHLHIEGAPEILPAAGATGAGEGHVRLAVVDITERHQVEEEKSRLEAQLRQSQKMEAIGTLAGGIAHDFNNILAAILGYAELARDDAKAGRLDPQDLEQIMVAATRAKNLVRQILTFSRRGPLDLRPLSLNLAVRQALELLGSSLPKMISVETRLQPELGLVNADATQVQQVLMNLASNAQDAMPDGGRLVIETQEVRLDDDYCRGHPEVRPGSYVLLQVSDTGQGIAPGNLDQIFDPFFTTKEVGKGTGLGLSTVYGIVKSHDGHIHCYSEPGSGTVFKIYLPVHREWGAGLVQMGSRDGEVPGGKETILLVDDEKALLQLGSRALSSRGYQVITADSGEKALQVYREQGGHPPSLIIMDLGMPGMGGVRCLKAILQINHQAKVLIASGYAADAQVKEALAAGAAGYVGKPFRRQELLGRVRAVLDGSGD